MHLTQNGTTGPSEERQGQFDKETGRQQRTIALGLQSASDAGRVLLPRFDRLIRKAEKGGVTKKPEDRERLQSEAS